MTTIPLNKLKFGDEYPGGSINARKSGRHDGLAELGATILDKGLIHALVVKTADGKPYVADGNRRLAAMRKLVGEKRLQKDWPVKIEEMDPEVDPLEASLTANIMQLPMHPVDQHEAFAKLAAAGKGIAEIAASFGTSDLIVRRRLALGRLSPKLREAWREDRLTAEAAEAFTVSGDHAFQEQVFTALAKGMGLHRFAIIRALTRSDQAHAGDLKFVGRAAYEAAGGRLVDDLFADEAHVLDADILKKLEREKVEAACRALVDEGWGWAAPVNDLPHDRWKWPNVEVTIVNTEEEIFRLEEIKPVIDAEAATSLDYRQREAARREAHQIQAAARLRCFTSADKARSGCVLRLTNVGELSIEYGIVRPDALPSVDAEAEERAPGTELIDGSATPEISGVLAQSVSEQLTHAAAKALALDPDLALRLFVATLQVTSASPARISSAGLSSLKSLTNGAGGGALGRTFAEAFEMTERSSRAHLLAAFSEFVAQSLDLTEAARHNPGKAVRGHALLVEALDPDDYLAAAREAFDADAYFDRAPVTVAHAAIEEMDGTKVTGRKGVIALAAATLAREIGWLPPMMRSSHYVPPVRGAAEKASSIERKGRKRKGSAEAVAS